jgi:nucleotide-binding universal stress UspA family protein
MGAIMYHDILVPLDGSTFSSQALSYALGVAQRMKATVHLVRVHTAAPPALNPAAPWFIDSATDQQIRAAESEELERIATLPRASGLRIQTALLDGPVAAALQSYVREMGVDVVVMTTHGRGGLSRVWLGSVADSLVRAVDVPVLLMRPTSSEPSDYGRPFGITHVLIPVDDPQFAEPIIEHAVRLGSFTSSRYTLVHVVPPPVPYAAEMAAARPTGEEFDELRARSRSVLEEKAAELRRRGLDVGTAVIVHAQTAAGILEYALEAHADLIAMATHARSGLTRMAMGSVADKVMRATDVPLLLLRPGGLPRNDPAIAHEPAGLYA